MSLIAALTNRSELGSPTRSATDYANAVREDGLARGTTVLTPAGWQKVEKLEPGDWVMTFDNGPQPIAALHTTSIDGASMPRHKAFVMRVPMQALGNGRSLRLLPNQEVLLESDIAERATGDPFVLIPSVLLSGYCGIETERLNGSFDVIMVTFQDEQILQVDGGLWAVCRAEADFSPFDVARTARERRVYARPDPRVVTALIKAIAEDQGRAA